MNATYAGSCTPTLPISIVRVRIKRSRITAPSHEKSSRLHTARSAPFPKSAGSITATSASPDRGPARPRVSLRTRQMADLSGRLSGSAPHPRGFRRSLVDPSPPVAVGPDVCTERRGGVSSADELSNRDRGCGVKRACPRRELPPLGCSYPSASGYGRPDGRTLATLPEPKVIYRSPAAMVAPRRRLCRPHLSPERHRQPKAVVSPTHPARSRKGLGAPLLIVGRIARS